MPDPLSIAGLLLQVGDIMVRVYKYGKQVKEAKYDMIQLYNELISLQGVLSHMIWQEEETKTGTGEESQRELFRSEIFLDNLQSSRNLLSRLSGNLEKRMSDHTYHKILNRLAWPIVKDEVKEDIAKLERVKTWFVLVMMVDVSVLAKVLLDKIQDISALLAESQQRDQDAQRKTIQDWLAPVYPDVAHSRAVNSRQENTGHWFTKKSFQDWLEGYDGKPKILWLTGKCNSSTAVDEAIRSLRTDADGRVAFFYCSFDDQMSQEPAMIVGSILCQLFHRCPEALQDVMSIYDGEVRPSVTTLQSLVLKHTAKLSRFIILVDAVNECFDPELVVRRISDLVRMSTNIRVLMTAITVPQGTDAPEALENYEEVDLDTAPLQDNIKSDMISYIENQMEERSKLRCLSTDLKKTIKTKILANANGMFRYVQCQIDYISTRKTDKGVKEALNQLPKDLSATYKRILARIPEYDRAMAKDAIHWLSFTHRPAKLAELAEAAVLREEDTDMNGDCRLHQPRYILDICQGLLTFDEKTSVVSLAHPSIRMFITSATLDAEAPWYFIPFALGDSYMTEKCLTYLMMDPFRAGFCTAQQLVSLVEKYPLLDYTACQWALHASAALAKDLSGTRSEPESSPLLQRILKFLATQKDVNGGSFALWLRCLMPNASSVTIMTEPLYYAASFGITPVVKALLLSPDTDIDAKGGRNQSTALQVATYRGHTELVALLLEAGADANSTDRSGCSNLFWARRKGFGDIEKLLRQHGASKDQQRITLRHTRTVLAGAKTQAQVDVPTATADVCSTAKVEEQGTQGT